MVCCRCLLNMCLPADAAGEACGEVCCRGFYCGAAVVTNCGCRWLLKMKMAAAVLMQMGAAISERAACA